MDIFTGCILLMNAVSSDNSWKKRLDNLIVKHNIEVQNERNK
jgi:hypothetical protein